MGVVPPLYSMESITDRTYLTHVAKLKQTLDRDQALKAAVGGEFLAVGSLERSLLISLALAPDSFVIDVGCGSGRLACQLAEIETLRYVGTDVVPELLDYARTLSGRKDWAFVQTVGTEIPAESGVADFVCFFSVFTHLSHEDTYRYLAEAKRVLKPGGKIVFSFLEFRIPCHWDIFQDSLVKSRTGLHLNQFMDRDGIQTWALNLGLKLDSIHNGDQPHIPLANPVYWENGTVMREAGNLGQSVAVLSKEKTGPISLDKSPVSTVLNLRTEAARATTEASARRPEINYNGRFNNVSSRGHAGKGLQSLIVGFVVSPGGRKILVRVQGPGLRKYGIETFLAVPWIEVVDSSGKKIASNLGWGNTPVEEARNIQRAMEELRLPELETHDAALILVLPAGAYSVVVVGGDGREGIAIVEVFELPEKFSTE